jgi:glycolate oxidase FAD binding subunit
MDLANTLQQRAKALGIPAYLIEPWERDGVHLLPSLPDEVAQCCKLLADQELSTALDEVSARRLMQPCWLDLASISRIRELEPDDLVVTAEAGLTVGRLEQALKPHGLTLPLVYPPHLPLYDVLASDRPSFQTGLTAGYPRDLILGLTVVGSDGEITKCGGKVVKNVSGYDLNKLYTGSFNTLAVPLTATLRLKARPAGKLGWLLRTETFEQSAQFVQALLKRNLSMLSTCEIISPGRLEAQDGGWSVFIVVQGDPPILELAYQEIRNVPRSAAVLHPLSDDAIETLMSRLGGWPSECPVLELGLPVDGWLTLTQRLMSNLKALGLSADWQIRPAAGLVYAIGEPDKPLHGTDWARALKEVRPLIAEYTGTSQWVQWPAAFPTDAPRANLPAHPVLLTLTRRVKSVYDPKNILRHHLWPVDPIPALDEELIV